MNSSSAVYYCDSSVFNGYAISRLIQYLHSMNASEAHRANTRLSVQALKSSVFKISAQKLYRYDKWAGYWHSHTGYWITTSAWNYEDGAGAWKWDEAENLLRTDGVCPRKLTD